MDSGPKLVIFGRFQAQIRLFMAGETPKMAKTIQITAYS